MALLPNRMRLLRNCVALPSSRMRLLRNCVAWLSSCMRLLRSRVRLRRSWVGNVLGSGA